MRLNDMLTRLWPAATIVMLPFFYFRAELATIAITQIVAFPLFACLILITPQRPGHYLRRWLTIGLFTWVIFVGLSTFSSIDPSSSVPFFVKFLGLISIFGISACLCRAPKYGSSLLFSAILAGTIHGSMAIYEYFQGHSIPASWLDPSMLGIIPTRCSGLFVDPNIFGGFLAALVPYILAGVFVLEETQDRFLATCAGIITILGLMTTFSRGAWLAAAAGIIVLFALMRPGRRYRASYVWILTMGIVLGVIFFAGPFKYRFASIFQPTDMTLSQRSLIVKGIMKNLEKIPLYGFGPHTFNQVYPSFRIVGGDYPQNAHNEILHTLLESGPLAAIILTLIVILLLFDIFSRFVRPSHEISWFYAAGSAAFVVLVVHNMGSFSSRIFPTAVLLAVFAGGIYSAMEQPDSLEKRPIVPNILVLSGILVICITTFLTLSNLRRQLLIAQASLQMRRGNFSQAAAVLDKARHLAPRNPYILSLAANCNYAQGNAKEALELLRRAATLNPTEARYWSDQSYLMENMGTGNPISVMQKAIELDPASERFRLRIAQLLAKKGKIHEAIVQLDQALEFSPGFHQVYKTYAPIVALREKLQSLIVKETE